MHNFKAVATHSSTLAWKVPWTEEPGELQSMGSQSQTRLSDFTLTSHFHALEKEMATHSSVLPGESQGRGSLVGCRLWGHTESDTTESTQQQQQHLMLSMQLILSLYSHGRSVSPLVASQVVLVIKNVPMQVRGASSIPRLGRSLGGGHGNPLQYFCLENPMDREA